jgi:hypothetical protein
MKMNTFEVNLREMSEDPHQLAQEHLIGPGRVGQEYINAYLAWYKHIGVPLPMKPYTKDPQGKFVNQDGSEILRDSARERQVIRNYLSSQRPDYQEELRRLADSLPHMVSECRVAIQIPVHNEEMNIYHMLKEWASQLSLQGELLEPSVYEINLLNNGPRGYKRDTTLAQVERFQHDFPDIKLNVLDVEFLIETGNVGMARKLTTDMILQRSLNRPNQRGPLYIESADADMFEIDKQTLVRHLQRLDSKSYLDAVSGQRDFCPQILMQNDYLFFSLRAKRSAKALLRDYTLRPDRNEDFSFFNRVTTGGWNTAFTAEAYALIGGYLPVKAGEDLDIGSRISIMRGTADNQGRFIPNTYTVERISTRMQSIPRRHIHAIAKDTKPYLDFADLQKTSEIRELNPSEMVSTLPYKRLSQENIAVFEKVLTNQWQFFTRTVKDPNNRLRVFRRFMLFLGFGRYQMSENEDGSSPVRNSRMSNEDSTRWNLDYHITADGKVVIENIGNLKDAFERYREKHTHA